MMELIRLEGIAGVDEAGRGPLAGPVVVAAVLLPANFPKVALQDSKKLTEKQRVELAEVIIAHAYVTTGVVSHEEIDRMNILRATLWGMGDCLSRLSPVPRSALIDGDKIPPNAPVPCSAVVKGDGTYAAVAAASIVAKTLRDDLMRKAAEKFPGYGFERHFGYPTPEHLEAVRRLGPCPIHRRSFSPIREMETQPCLEFAE